MTNEIQLTNEQCVKAAKRMYAEYQLSDNEVTMDFMDWLDKQLKPVKRMSIRKASELLSIEDLSPIFYPREIRFCILNRDIAKILSEKLGCEVVIDE